MQPQRVSDRLLTARYVDNAPWLVFLLSIGSLRATAGSKISYFRADVNLILAGYRVEAGIGRFLGCIGS